MNINELTNYHKWIGTPANEVYFAVRAAGGWKNIFPQSVPRWASKVRNYFNVFPTTLQRVPEKSFQIGAAPARAGRRWVKLSR